MKTLQRLIGALLLPLAVACSDQGAAAGTLESMASPPNEAPENEPVQSADRLDIECGGHQFSLAGAGDAAAIERNRGSRLQTLRKPDGMADYVPIGMGCTRSPSGDEYLVVEYGEPLIGCNICEWFFVYDGDGQPLNESVPAMLDDVGSLYPNNQGYAEVTRRLGLQRHEIQYAPRPKPLDVKD
jgi:hypothetical protein